MQIRRPLAIIGALLVFGISGCTSTGGDTAGGESAGGDASLIQFMLDPAEANGWLITPDDGPVGGDSPDCTGAPYEWPDLTTVAHASQFLSHPDETVAVVLKRLNGVAAPHVEALRGALAPCSPPSGERAHGAMIKLVGDDSFSYQTSGSDELDQAALEGLVSPVVARIGAHEGCSG